MTPPKQLGLAIAGSVSHNMRWEPAFVIKIVGYDNV